MLSRLASVAVFLLLTLNAVVPAAFSQSNVPPIEAYGMLPSVSDIAISPNGDHVAMIRRSGDENSMQVIDLAQTKLLINVDIGDLNAGAISWAGKDHVILRAAETTRIDGFTDKVNYSGAYSVNITTGKLKQLVVSSTRRSANVGSNIGRGEIRIFPGQSGIGRIVGKKAGENTVFMPAYTGVENNPPYSLLEVDLDTGRPKMYSRGTEHAVDWFVDSNGTILAREEYDNAKDQYTLKTQKNGEWEIVEEYKTEYGAAGLVGITPDHAALVLFSRNSQGYNELRQLNYDGTQSDAIMSKANTEINYVLLDSDRVVHGVAYGGLKPSYDFFDKDISQAVSDMQAQAGEASVRLSSWSDGFEKLIFYVEGTGHAGDYFMLDRKTSDLKFLSTARPDIPKAAIGEVLTINYKATDGLEIPGVITVPNGSDVQNLPTIIMPHGGPEAFDDVKFDWMAQYFASRGYLVFQPNFRGSDGFGQAFTNAGYGGWGGVMQQDITDGVAALTSSGMTDPARVCIVGWSYGGYAALAGGALTPDLYKCVGAIAPVSDLPRLLLEEERDHGKDHWVVTYWENAIAKGDANRDFLKERSPAYLAEQFKAPVLLIHGRDDLIVRVTQSERMKKALERADKDVKLIKMKGEGHSLSTPGARLEALQALDTFIAEHIGPHPKGG